MSENFDWQTEEDEWQEEPPTSLTTIHKRRNGRIWLVLLFALLVAGYTVYRQVNQQVARTVETAEQDVFASFRLLRSAALNGDDELFYSLLSGREPRWTETQAQLSQQGLLFGREIFHLLWVNQDPENPQVTLSPDLDEAIVTAEQLYTLPEGDIVRLQQTAVFRRGAAQQWLFAPPSADFWGHWQYFPDKTLSLTYPARDQEISLRLAADLKDKLHEMCQVLADLSCPDDLNISLRLESDPTVWFDLANPMEAVIGSHYIVLPTPTLLGLPIDEAGYQVLFQAYAEQVLSRVITDLVGWQCCGFHPLFHQALLYVQLDELGIRPFPLTAVHYESILNQGTTLGNLNTVWATPLLLPPNSPDWASALAATQFTLQQVPGVSSVAMQRQLGTYENFWSWLERWLSEQGFRAGDEAARQSLEQAWLHFIYGRSQAEQRPLPTPFPEQGFEVMCGAEDGLGMYGYDLTHQQWTTRLNRPHLLALYPLPGDEGVLLEERLMAEGEWKKQFIWWHKGQETILYVGTSRDELDTRQGETRLPYVTIFQPTRLQRGFAVVHMIDMSDCANGQCQPVTLAGMPTWSPSGQQAIFSLPIGTYLGTPENGVEIFLTTNGRSPFWLNESLHGHVANTQNTTPANQTVMMGENGRFDPFFTTLDLLSAFPPATRPNDLYISYIAASPFVEQTLLVAARYPDPVNPKVYIFAVQWQKNLAAGELYSSQVSLILEAEGAFANYPSFQFSPNGRWLTMTSNSFRHPARTLYLYDLLAKELQVLPAPNTFLRYDWSADGEWLLRAEDNYLSLYAPAYQYRQLIFHNYGDCPFVAWVNNQ